MLRKYLNWKKNKNEGKAAEDVEVHLLPSFSAYIMKVYSESLENPII